MLTGPESGPVFRLTVDFAAGSLDGDIRRFRMEEPGQSRVTLPLTVYADITDGEIANGQFTATWTQVVPDLDAGEIFSGDMLGEFYGPNAEEVGGVFNGTNDDEIFAGWFGGVRPTPSVPGGDLAVLSSGSHQDVVNSTVAASDGAVTAIASDDADGFNLTYAIGSDTFDIQLGANDFGGDPFIASTELPRTVGQSGVFPVRSDRLVLREPGIQPFQREWLGGRKLHECGRALRFPSRLGGVWICN